MELICGKLFKKHLLKEKLIEFPEYLPNGKEDFVYNYIMASKTAAQCERHICDFYAYPLKSIVIGEKPFYETVECRMKIFNENGIALDEDAEYAYRFYKNVGDTLFDICSDGCVPLREKKRMIGKVFSNQYVEEGVNKFVPSNSIESMIMFLMSKKFCLFTYIFILFCLKRKFTV